MVEASSANKKIRVSVSSKTQKNVVKASNSLARYFQELAMLWATSTTIVDNTDYSAKYYAEKSQNSADTSELLLEQTKTEAETALNNIQDSKNAAIDSIITTENTSIENIENKTTDSLNTVISEGETQRELLNADVTSAKKAAEEANISAENAAQSELNALSYKNSAMESKEAALISENNAKISETNSATSESNAQSYLQQTQSASITAINNITTEKENAITNINSSKDIAINSINELVTTASEYAESSKNYSIISSEQANISTQKAAEATTSAASASQSMTSASNYAAEAKKAAEEAISGQLQADFSQSDSTAKDFIKNKPTNLSNFIDDLGSSPTHTHAQYLKEAETLKVQEITLEDYLELKKKDADTLYVVCTEFLIWGSSSWGIGIWGLQDE